MVEKRWYFDTNVVRYMVKAENREEAIRKMKGMFEEGLRRKRSGIRTGEKRKLRRVI